MTQNKSDRIVSAETWVLIALCGAAVVGWLGVGGMIAALELASYADAMAIGVSALIITIVMVVLAFSLEKRMDARLIK